VSLYKSLSAECEPRQKQTSPRAACRVLPPGKFNGMITQPLYPVYYVSYKTIAVTVFSWCC